MAAGESAFAQESQVIASDIPSLSARELEVLRHFGRGLSNQELGAVLGISAETIKSHVKSIYLKLDAVDRAEAIARAYELGLLSTD